MSGITVIDGDGDLQRFADAKAWHVDDHGRLHLKDGEAQVATFAKDGWQGVASSERDIKEMRSSLQAERPRELPLRVVKVDDGYSIKLAGTELSSVLLSDGFKIEFKRPIEGLPDQPEVTMTFAAGAIDLDLDADLIAYLRDADKAAQS